MKWAEFEDTSTLGSLYRMVKIDSVDNANEPDSERKASRERTKDVTKKPNSLRWVQLRCSHFFLPVVHGDGRPSSSAQIANPVNVAPGGPDPTPAQDLDTASAVVRGKPLFRPRMVISRLKPSGTPAAKRNWRIALKNLTRGGTRVALTIRSPIS